MTNWNCVETRIDNGTKYGRIVRKIVFGDIFANRSQLLSQNPLNNNHKKLLKVSYFGLENCDSIISIWNKSISFLFVQL